MLKIFIDRTIHFLRLAAARRLSSPILSIEIFDKTRNVGMHNGHDLYVYIWPKSSIHMGWAEAELEIVRAWVKIKEDGQQKDPGQGLLIYVHHY